MAIEIDEINTYLYGDEFL